MYSLATDTYLLHLYVPHTFNHIFAIHVAFFVLKNKTVGKSYWWKKTKGTEMVKKECA